MAKGGKRPSREKLPKIWSRGGVDGSGRGPQLEREECEKRKKVTKYRKKEKKVGSRSKRKDLRCR